MNADARKEAEEALRVCEERLDRILNVDAVGILVFNDSGTLMDSNEAFQKMTGYSQEDITSRKLTWRDMTPPEYVEISEQQLLHFGAHGRIGPYEKEYLRKDGSRAWMLFAGANTGDGTIVEYCIDLSDRKRAEALAREARAYAEDIIQTLHEPLLVLTPELQVESVNPAFYRHFKVQPAETLGRRIYDLGNGQWDIPALRQLLEDVLPQNRVIEEFEVIHDFESIGSRVFLLNARKLDHRGLILLGLRDVTERKRAEQKLSDQVDQSAEALSATQAELRTLASRLIATQEQEQRRIARELHDDLTQRTAVIEFTLGHVARFIPTAEGSEALSAAREHLARLASGLRDVSHRLYPTAITDLGLTAALRQQVQEFNEAGGDAYFVGRDKTPRLNPEVATALYRIAQEALHNARKHAPGSGVRVVYAKTGQHVRLSIEDTGPGFNLHEIYEGRGLGLLSMQERARMVGGRFTLSTRPGEGTRITVQIRVPQPEKTT